MPSRWALIDALLQVLVSVGAGDLELLQLPLQRGGAGLALLELLLQVGVVRLARQQLGLLRLAVRLRPRVKATSATPWPGRTGMRCAGGDGTHTPCRPRTSPAYLGLPQPPAEKAVLGQQAVRVELQLLHGRPLQPTWAGRVQVSVLGGQCAEGTRRQPHWASAAAAAAPLLLRRQAVATFSHFRGPVLRA